MITTRCYPPDEAHLFKKIWPKGDLKPLGNSPPPYNPWPGSPWSLWQAQKAVSVSEIDALNQVTKVEAAGQIPPKLFE